MIKSGFDGVEVACAGVDDHLTIFLTNEKLAEEVKAYVVDKTGLNSVAFNTFILNEIPKNDSGKTLYKELEKYLEY